MTDTFKEQLLNYLTGKIDMQTGTNHPWFSSIELYQNNLYTYIADHTVQPVSGTYKLIKGKDGNGDELDEHLLYGVDDYDNSGFIVILNVMFQPVQFINTYSSGTKLGVFEQLIVDDDGRFYGVEYTNSTRRFVMLNNILVKSQNQTEYQVILRKSYNLPEILQYTSVEKLIKKPLDNRYLFGTTILNGSLLVYQPTVVELTINVGAPNEWKEYVYSTESCNLNSLWASWDTENNLKFLIVAIYVTPSQTSGSLYVLKNSGDNIVKKSNYVLPQPDGNWQQAVILNENTIYYSYCDTDDNGIYNQYIYQIGDTLTQIFKSPNTDVALPGSLMKSDLYTDGINVFISFNVPNADDTIDYYMGIIFNDNVYYINFGDLTYTTSQMLYSTNTFHQFNLYKYYLQLGDMAYIANSIFNNFNYNGYAYTNINGLLPNSAILANNVGKPLFARNLYNKVITDNITVSTVEIPNTILNYNLGPAYEIAQQQLYSQTNQQLNLNEEIIDKNIYENVNINFYNAITMKDKNNINNEITRFNEAVRLNKSVSRDLDYFEVQATKARINYNDGTYYIVAIDPSTQITITNGIATYSFMIYAPTNKTITNLEIISYDETLVYATINGTFTPGKYYTITQDVYIE